MSNVILTPYRLFFIDQTDILYALMKDGRLSRVKKVDSFANASADFQNLTGVRFDGENTHVTSVSLDFDSLPTELAPFFGYAYYPTLNKDASLLSLIRADLLSPRPFGVMIIYKKLRKKWKPIVERKSFMKRPVWSKFTDSLFFINIFQQLVKITPTGEEEILAHNVVDFALSPLQTEAACWDGKFMHIISVLDKTENDCFPASALNTFAYSSDGHSLNFSVTLEGKNNMYCIDKASKKTLLLLQTPSLVPFIFTP